MTPPRHTPYDGSARPFQIGLKPLDVGEWIDADAGLGAYLDEKQRLIDTRLPDILVAEPGTEAAQAELLHLLAEHLPARYPDIYVSRQNAIDIVPAARRVALDDSVAPLLTAARLVQEDLVLMRKGETGWRLAAAVLCFPSAWLLAEKFGRPMHEIHGPVPGFGAGTRPAELIERMFDKLRPELPMIRWNWSLFGDDRLFHPESGHPDRPRFGDGTRAETIVFRVERQTLRKLPLSGDIVFTIRIYNDPVTALEAHPDAAAIAAALLDQLEAMSDEQRSYKGLALERQQLAQRFSEIANR